MSGAAFTVARSRKPTSRWVRFTTAIGIIVLSSAFLLWMFWGWIAWGVWGQAPETVTASAPMRDFSMGQPLEQKPAARMPPPPPADAKAPLPVVAAPPPPPPVDTKGPVMRPMAVWQAPASPLTTQAARPVAKPTSGDDDDDELSGTGTAKDSAYARDMQVTRVEDARPKFHRFPPRYTIKKGQTFGCTPPMPIDTQMPGPLWCDVDQDVYSMDGTMILIPAHSQANGTIEHGLGLGQDRAVIVFTDILTAGPDFLPIPLGSSMGASDLGQNGVPVDVNGHEWAKIKNVLLFAGVEGLSSGVQASLQKGGGNQYFGSFGNTGQSLATIAAQHDLTIPTTGYRGPGRPIKIYVNHYIDLSNFYGVTLRKGR